MALTKAKLEELIEAGDIVIPGGGGGLSNPMPDTTLIENLNADLLDGNHASAFAPAVHTHPFSNPNILHNWDFRNPVNQRAVTGAITTGTYFFDRWIRNSGTVTVGAGYLTLASGAEIEQRIEGLYLAGETVTVSVKVGSNIYSGTGVFPISAGTAAVTLTGFGTATLGYNAGYMFVRFTAPGSQNVVSVKCELGTASTLHPDPPMDHAVELPKCQRYYEVIGDGHYFLAYSAEYCTVSFPFVIEKRVTPTLVALVGALSLTDSVADYTASNFTIISSLLNTRGLKRAVLGTWSNLAAGKVYYLADDCTRLFGFSADL